MLNRPIRSAMCALMPRAAGLPGMEDTEVDAFIARFRREAPFRLWIGVLAGALLFAILPLFTIGVPLPAGLLGARHLERYVNEVTHHPWYLVRQSIFLLKMAAGMCWGADPAVRARLALPPYPPDPGTWRSS